MIYDKKINKFYNLSYTTNKIIKLKMKLRNKLHEYFTYISHIFQQRESKTDNKDSSTVNINSSGTKFHRTVKMSMFRAYARFPGMGALPQSVPQLTRIEFSRLNDTAPKDFMDSSNSHIFRSSLLSAPLFELLPSYHPPQEETRCVYTGYSRFKVPNFANIILSK